MDVLAVSQDGAAYFAHTASGWLTWSVLNELDHLSSGFVNDDFKGAAAIL